ncbi:MAG TPA: heme-copper oxidase subunit III [Pyrinomonadaceae bacterium]|nr:heme-copper oxidase subunit III [Pyrinomonadaceae bacterium]
MKAGTVEPSIKNVDPKRWSAKSGFTGGGESGDGPDRKRPEFSEPESSGADKARIVTSFLLLVVLMTFGGLIGAYVVLATNGAAEWRPFELPVQVWISTGLILLSSATYELARNALFAEQYDRSRKFLIATAALGAAFISSQLLVWLALVSRGFYLRGNPYAGFFYILTAVHAVHVAGGIAALGTILLRTWTETMNADEIVYRRNLARSVGWYWHFMGVLWIVLLTLLGFWK